MTDKNYPAPGKHVLLDLWGAHGMEDSAFIDRSLRAAAKACGATVLDMRLHHFGEGMGVTGVAVLAESHISIHTWPETDFAALDVFVCGSCDADLAAQSLLHSFAPRKSNIITHARGLGLDVRADEKAA